MRWVTRRNVHVDRTACPWLIRRFIDADAEFVFVPADTEPATIDGHTFDMRGAEFGHEGTKCTFEVMVERWDLSGDPALVEMGRIIRDADVPPSRTRRPEGPGLDALIRGFQLSFPDDHEKLRLTAPLYDALYAYCQAKVATPPPKQGTPRPRLRYARRVAEHLELAEDDASPEAPGGDLTMETKTILFLCPHNAAKSVLAVAHFDRLARQRGLPYRADSAGTEPEAAPAAAVVAALRAEGIDVAGHQPRHLQPADLARAVRVVNMGCAREDLPPSRAPVEQWDDVPPVSRDLDAAYAAIRRRVEALIAELETEHAAQP